MPLLSCLLIHIALSYSYFKGWGGLESAFAGRLWKLQEWVPAFCSDYQTSLGSETGWYYIQLEINIVQRPGQVITDFATSEISKGWYNKGNENASKLPCRTQFSDMGDAGILIVFIVRLITLAFSWKEIRLLEDISRILRHCQENHSECPSNTPHILPTRVVDLGVEDKCKPRLHILVADQKAEYTAPSYCWSGS